MEIHSAMTTKVEIKALRPTVFTQNAVQGYLYAAPDILGLDRGLSVVAYDFPNGRVAGFYIIPDAHMSVHEIDGSIIITLYSSVDIDPEKLKEITMEYFDLPNVELN